MSILPGRKQHDQEKHIEIISIDPSSLSAYSYSKNEIKNAKLEKVDTDSFFTTYLHTRDVISTTIDISTNVPATDLKDALEIKVYDELALDPAIEYIISYTETPSKDTKNRAFNVFIIDALQLRTKLSSIHNKVHYIDYVTSAPFLIQGLYRKNILGNDGTHCFIYFQNNDAFLTLYKGGQYIYSKSLHYSLQEMNEKFCEILGERYSESDFLSLLGKEGLNAGAETLYQNALSQLFSEIFLYINDVLMFSKRSYNIEDIDKIYIGSSIGSIKGIETFVEGYLGLQASAFNFNIAINSKEWYIDQMHVLMMLSAQLYMEDLDDTLNFSIYKRPPPLKDRPAGKFLGVIATSLIISMIYPAFQTMYDVFLSFQIYQNTKKYEELFQQNTLLRQELSSLKNEKDKIDSLVKNETNKLEFRKKLLSEIYNKKASYPMKAVILFDIFKLVNQNGCKIETLEFTNDHFVLLLQNQNEKKITEFIQDLVNLQKYKIYTEKISQDEMRHLYTSKVMVGL